MCCLKKIIRVDSSRHVRPEFKIGLPNLGINEFFCGKRLIHSKKHINRCLFIEFEKKSLKSFLRYSLTVSFTVCPIHFRFPDFHQNLEIYAVV